MAPRKTQRASNINFKIINYLRTKGSAGAVIDKDFARVMNCSPSGIYTALKRLTAARIIIGTCAKASHGQTFSIHENFKTGDTWKLLLGRRGRRVKAQERLEELRKKYPTTEVPVVVPKTTPIDLIAEVQKILNENSKLQAENAKLREQVKILCEKVDAFEADFAATKKVLGIS